MIDSLAKAIEVLVSFRIKPYYLNYCMIYQKFIESFYASSDMHWSNSHFYDNRDFHASSDHPSSCNKPSGDRFSLPKL